jgi:branched-subunit amino acid aminotransferase/4-amino-4-deoxychorismate lyase
VSETLVYLNGRMLPASEAHLPIYDLGIVQGATVTEMTRTFRHRLWRLDEHLQRLGRSLRYTRMNLGLSWEELVALSEQLVAHNAQHMAAHEELGLVHFVTAGEHAIYANLSERPPRSSCTVCAHTFRLPFERWARHMQEGVHVVTPSIRQVPPQCLDPKIKYRSRLHYYLAEQEARLVDPEAVALLLDVAGNVTETNAANLLLLEAGTVVSPPAVYTLPGISRAMVIELCGQLGMPFRERDLQTYHVMNADEAFLASTPYCLMPVTKINGASIGTGRPGPVFSRLLSAWSQVVGVDIGGQIIEGGRNSG